MLCTRFGSVSTVGLRRGRLGLFRADGFGKILVKLEECAPGLTEKDNYEGSKGPTMGR